MSQQFCLKPWIMKSTVWWQTLFTMRGNAPCMYKWGNIFWLSSPKYFFPGDRKPELWSLPHPTSCQTLVDVHAVVEQLHFLGVIAMALEWEGLQTFYSNLYFTIPKAIGGIFPILNPKSLNGFLLSLKILYGICQSVITLVHSGIFLTSLDIRDVYFHIPHLPSGSTLPGI